MTKTVLSLALAVSVLLNLALLRRGPAAVPEPRPAGASPQPPTALPPATPSVEINADVVLLQEQVRRLREQLTVARAKNGLQRNNPTASSEADAEEPDAREFQQLHELLESHIEFRMVDGRDETGNLVKVQKPVLTPEHRQRALDLIADYLGLENAARRSFQELARSAMDAYHRILDAYYLENRAAEKASENDEFYEDGVRRKQTVWQTLNRRHEEWKSGHLQGLREFLGRRDGVRPALLSDALAGLLTQLGGADER